MFSPFVKLSSPADIRLNRKAVIVILRNTKTLSIENSAGFEASQKIQGPRNGISIIFFNLSVNVTVMSGDGRNCRATGGRSPLDRLCVCIRFIMNEVTAELTAAAFRTFGQAEFSRKQRY